MNPIQALLFLTAMTLGVQDEHHHHEPRGFLHVPPGTEYHDFLRLMDGRADWRMVILDTEHIEDHWLDAIAACAGIGQLYINAQAPAASLTAKGLEKLSACPRLRTFQWLAPPNAPEAGDHVVEAIALNLPRVNQLILGGFRVTDAGLALMADKLKGLRLLHLFGADVSDEGMRSLGALNGLRSLYLSPAEAVTDEGLAALAPLAALRELQLDTAAATNDGVAALAGGQAKFLGVLRLPAAAMLGDAALEALTGRFALTELDFSSGADFTSEGVNAFRAANPQAMLRLDAYERVRNRAEGPRNAQEFARRFGTAPEKTLWIPPGADYDELVHWMDNRTDWEAIRCESDRLADDWMALVAECADLRVFSNTSVNPEGLTSAGAAMLASCARLRILEICSANTFRDADMARIAASCPELEQLHICDSGDYEAGNETLFALADCVKLRRITLRGVAVGVDMEFLRYFASQLPDLEWLRIDGNGHLIPADLLRDFRRDRPEVWIMVVGHPWLHGANGQPEGGGRAILVPAPGDMF